MTYPMSSPFKLLTTDNSSELSTCIIIPSHYSCPIKVTR